MQRGSKSRNRGIRIAPERDWCQQAGKSATPILSTRALGGSPGAERRGLSWSGRRLNLAAGCVCFSSQSCQQAEEVMGLTGEESHGGEEANNTHGHSPCFGGTND